MIRSFSCKETERIWNGNFSSKFPSNIQERALRKLRQLEVSNSLNDLRNPPGNHLEKLQGEKHEYMSIRVNNQWRICFLWKNNEAYEVKILDYH